MESGQQFVRKDLLQYKSAPNLTLNDQIKSAIAKGATIYHLAFGQSPFPVIPAAQTALAQRVAEKDYEPTCGIEALRQAICDYHRRVDGIEVSSENTIVGPGSKSLLFLLFLVFEGDIFLLSPSWTTYHPQCLLSRKKPIIVQASSQTEWKLTPQALEKALACLSSGTPKLLVFNNPNNPTGIVYTEEELKALCHVFRRNNVLVLSDEIYARFHFANDHHCLAKFYPDGTIVANGISKWAGAGGWRIGYLLFPPSLGSLKKAVEGAASHSYSSASAPIQYASIEMFKPSDDIDDYVKHARRILCSLADYCYRELTSVGVEIVKPQGGFYMFPDFEVVRPYLRRKKAASGDKMCALILQEASVALLAGGPAFLRPTEELTVRLCYTHFDGAKALLESRAAGLENCLTDEFLSAHCSLTVKGIEALKSWVIRARES
ncbi:aspartate aminotransferase-like isoform X2 [Oscarella lobularis]|uniref:aspartate aminotransferase-like isoform X2 n=1 Tax=Oscarella lobularis TaxID=121494 RepID=UPI0033138CA1